MNRYRDTVNEKFYDLSFCFCERSQPNQHVEEKDKKTAQKVGEAINVWLEMGG